MTNPLLQLAALRRIREQQASAELQRRTTRLREHEEELARLRADEEDTLKASAGRIARLYGHCVDSPLSPAELDMLMLAVDRQYTLRAEARAAVIAAEEALQQVQAEMEEARRKVTECRRNVEKLDLIFEKSRVAADRRAEVIAEAEAERPPASNLFTAVSACP